ncbi:MAG: hypothetical protein KatS3mg108_2437 [Isosphaeraceae bacterium]|jgi:lipid-A-disaccharide synthase-like uncharacterized protein|nr:MAG: hypothetical protein KatS3mg108_2437 [Isosphaeraceae bacterium]
MPLGPWLQTAALAVAHTAQAGTCPTCGHQTRTVLWLTIGFVGQAVFTARFLAQWIASERSKNSVVPVVFWWLSLIGGLLLLSYAIAGRDPVITVGQSMGVFIYVRNLMLVAKGRRCATPAPGQPATSSPPPSTPHRRPVRIAAQEPTAGR